MLKIHRVIVSIFVCCLLSPVGATAAPMPMPAPPAVGAESYVLMAAQSGQFLVSENPNLRVEPASITKVMTAYVVFQELEAGRIQMGDQVTVSEKAWREPGSRMFIEVDTQVSVEDLLRGMIVQSGNDASVALAEYVAGTEQAFAGLMNHYAEQLGLSNTHYVNATGLPHEKHYTTAHDVAVLSAALIETFPSYYSLFAEKEFTYNDIRQYNRNDLLWRDPSVDGLKTGHTQAAGYCLAASARQGDMRLISVVMSADSEKARVDDSQALLSYGFRFFETHSLYAAGEPLQRVTVWKGEVDQVPVGIIKTLYVTVPQGRYGQLNAQLKMPGALTAPIRQGAVLGQLRVSLGDETLAETPLIALQPVALGGWWQRLTDRVRLWFAGDDE